ncbi:MAG: hypothetical protein A3K19_26810 [Lentisphaerae bacterium RIFOXYB12_FULL_65_16]|nr:MAG: hypothetical protein A3K18_03350 [Lentisphaerae bacterium RIFOXYA12_64_32]OGV84330.1 MAG: hypothetical protein A3K19_26810 [Lentisphaerae bacterium RIFOXYB12_FULL_65_16]
MPKPAWTKVKVSAAALDKLAPAERQIREFVETHMVDECGLVYSFMNAKTVKPWTDAELKAYNLRPVCHPNVNNPAEYYAYENSLMGTGEYAASQVARFETTGDGEALGTAAHQVSAMMQVFYQGELFEKGFLPKPFGGIRKCAYSHELSPDQHIKTLVALRAYQRHAPPSQKRRIDEYIVALADYHQARGFIHPRRESFVVTPENRPHHICILVPVLMCAYNITGDAKYKDALSRFNAIMDDYAAGKFEAHFNLAALMIEGYHLAICEGLDDERLRIAIRKLWEAHVEFVLDDGLGYVDKERTKKSSESLRLAGLAPLVDQYFPDLNACQLGLFLLQKNTDPQRMLYINETAKPMDYHGPLAESICELAVASWLLGYWRLRARRAPRAGCGARK